MASEDNPVYRSANWLGRHWLAVFNSFVGLYVLLPLLAPLLMSWGLTQPARWIYTVYAPTCHQLAFRSVFINGEQFVYPRANVDLLDQSLTRFETLAATLPEFAGVSLSGLGTDLLLAGRSFVGNLQMGYKTAICQRDLAIFGAVFVGGVLFGWLRQRRSVRPLPLWAFVLLGMGPIGLDGFSQLFGYYLPLLPMRESPPYMRFLTGALFGLCLAWLALPHIQGSMRDAGDGSPAAR